MIRLSLITVLILFPCLNYGQVKKNHILKITLNKKVEPYFINFWNKVHLSNDQTGFSQSYDLRNSDTEIKTLPTGLYKIRITSIFNDCIDTVINFSERIIVQMDLSVLNNYYQKESQHINSNKSILENLRVKDTLSIIHIRQTDISKDTGRIDIIREDSLFYTRAFKDLYTNKYLTYPLTPVQISDFARWEYLLRAASKQKEPVCFTIIDHYKFIHNRQIIEYTDLMCSKYGLDYLIKIMTKP